ncbi:MAG TPA: hypothetical protein VKU77_09445, partial [Streptosporangiaceae bacterium]|nr:hypothetical protein [Streptosporangiaceae bacterium]
HPQVVARAGRVIVPEVVGMHLAVREPHPRVRGDAEEEPKPNVPDEVRPSPGRPPPSGSARGTR